MISRLIGISYCAQLPLPASRVSDFESSVITAAVTGVYGQGAAGGLRRMQGAAEGPRLQTLTRCLSQTTNKLYNTSYNR